MRISPLRQHMIDDGDDDDVVAGGDVDATWGGELDAQFAADGFGFWGAGCAGGAGVTPPRMAFSTSMVSLGTVFGGQTLGVVWRALSWASVKLGPFRLGGFEGVAGVDGYLLGQITHAHESGQRVHGKCLPI